MKSRILIFVITILVSYPAMLLPQPGISVQSSGGYTSNVFGNYRTLPDYYSNFNIYANNDWLNEDHGLRVYYDGNVTMFDQYRDKNYFKHEFGLSLYHDLNKNGDRLYAGTGFSNRKHTENYKWFELFESFLYVNTRIKLMDQLYGYAGLQVTNRNYKNLDAFSHWQSMFFARVSRFFDTGTTIIVEADLSSKNYITSAEKSVIEGFPEMITVGDGQSRQVVALFRMAQALSLTTGLSGQLSIRRNLSNSVRYLGTSDGFYYSDEEVFNDVFGYNAREFELTLKQKLPWNMKLSAGSMLNLNEYNNRLALDLEGNPFPDERFRNDNRLSNWFMLEKTIRLSQAVDPMKISAGWTSVNNKSNDVYYDYRTSYFSFTVSQDF
ncbi:hypothetical protein JXQ31_06260 [candidate division KSB1 bacterium]|nr:hypothetical protein [candidate division KSB1 bacterium]